MRPSSWLLPLAALPIGFVSCGSEITSTRNDALLEQVELVLDCFPNLWPFADGVLDIARQWQLNGGNNPEDPDGLTWEFTGAAPKDVTATLAVRGTTITMVLSAYEPDGTKVDAETLAQSGTIPITLGVSQLSEVADNIATQLRDSFPSPTERPYFVGVWSLGGAGISAAPSGLLGIIGGAANDNELEELRTVVADASMVGSDGYPLAASSTITDSGTTPPCTLTFGTESLVTDEDPDQEYPEGVVTVSIADGSKTVDLTITFDKSPVAVLRIADTPGRFEYNAVTREFTSAF